MTALILLLILVAILAILLFVVNLDKSRIAAHLQSKGFKFTGAQWRIFGHGWLGESSGEGGNRIYRVSYLDVFGNAWEVWAKTRMFSGVYLSLEEMVLPAKKVVSHLAQSKR